MNDSDCVFCEKPSADVLHELPHVWHQPPQSGKVVVRWCEPCSVGFVNPQPDDARLAALYGSEYFGSYGRRQHGPSPSGLSALLWRVLTHLAWRMDRGCAITAEFMGRFVPVGGSVCDVGCGPGNLLTDLRAHGYATCGIEPDSAAVKLCSEKGLDVYQGTAEQLPAAVKGRSFDAVVMTQVLEHCREPLKALRAAAGMLRPGGYLIVEVPNAGSLVARTMGPHWFHADVGRHLYFFTPKSVASLAQQAGTDVVDTVFSDYTAQFLPDRVSAEREVWDCLRDGARPPTAAVGKRPSLVRSGLLLARTAVASREKRYGVVAVVAQRRLNDTV